MKTYLRLVCGLIITASAAFFPLSVPAASKPVVTQGSAQLIIWRSANLGNRLSLNLWVDGKPIAPVSQGQTYRGSLSAGTHVVSALLVPNLLYLPPTKINLTAIPGKTYAYTAI